MLPFIGGIFTGGRIAGRAARGVDDVIEGGAAASKVLPSGRTLARYTNADKEALERFNEAAAELHSGGPTFDWVNEVLDPEKTVYVVKNANNEIEGAVSWSRMTFQSLDAPAGEAVHIVNLESISSGNRQGEGAGQDLLRSVAEYANDEGLGIIGTAGSTDQKYFNTLRRYYRIMGGEELVEGSGIFWVSPEKIRQLLARKNTSTP